MRCCFEKKAGGEQGSSGIESQARIRVFMCVFVCASLPEKCIPKSKVRNTHDLEAFSAVSTCIFPTYSLTHGVQKRTSKNVIPAIDRITNFIGPGPTKLQLAKWAVFQNF